MEPPMTDPLPQAYAAASTAFDRGGPTDRAVTSTVEPMEGRDRPQPRKTHGRSSPPQDARPAGAPRRTRSSTRVVRPPSTVAERYHPHLIGLVQRVFLTADLSPEPVRSLMFMSVEGGQQSALLPAAAAEILVSHTAGRICLVDANFLAPSLHEHYGVLNTRGLANALADDEPVSRHARLLAQGPQSSLWLVPSGSAEDAGQPALSAVSNGNRIRELIDAFDYVVIEAPAVAHHMAASVIGAAVDGAVLVAEADVTTRSAIRTAAETLLAGGTHVLGTVLNNRRFPVPEPLYRLL